MVYDITGNNPMGGRRPITMGLKAGQFGYRQMGVPRNVPSNIFINNNSNIGYEWFRVRAKEKIAISGKFTNENSKGKNNITDGDDLYKSQIIARVL